MTPLRRIEYAVEENAPCRWQACIYQGSMLITIIRGFDHDDVAERVMAQYPNAVETDTPPNMGGWLLITDTPRTA